MKVGNLVEIGNFRYIRKLIAFTLGNVMIRYSDQI